MRSGVARAARDFVPAGPNEVAGKVRPAGGAARGSAALAFGCSDARAGRIMHDVASILLVLFLMLLTFDVFRWKILVNRELSRQQLGKQKRDSSELS